LSIGRYPISSIMRTLNFPKVFRANSNVPRLFAFFSFADSRKYDAPDSGNYGGFDKEAKP
jgi:hypothetical protein